MTGTHIGAQKTRAANLKRNPNFFQDIGRKGGKAKVPKGFALLPKDELQLLGSKGGKRSRHGLPKEK